MIIILITALASFAAGYLVRGLLAVAYERQRNREVLTGGYRRGGRPGTTAHLAESMPEVFGHEEEIGKGQWFNGPSDQS